MNLTCRCQETFQLNMQENSQLSQTVLIPPEFNFKVPGYRADGQRWKARSYGIQNDTESSRRVVYQETILNKYSKSNAKTALAGLTLLAKAEGNVRPDSLVRLHRIVWDLLFLHK